MCTNTFKIKLVEPGAMMPARTNDSAAGYDLFLPKDTVINPGRQIVPLGFSMSLPDGIVGWVTSRSGFASKGIVGVPLGQAKYDNNEVRFDADVLDGRVDPDYRGIVGIIVKSYEDVPFIIPEHTKIGQMVLVPFAQLVTVEVNDLDDTDRGANGFGSTGAL